MRRSQTYKGHREKLRQWRMEMHKVFREAGALRTEEDMTDEERAEIEKIYDMPFKYQRRSEREEGEE